MRALALLLPSACWRVGGVAPPSDGGATLRGQVTARPGPCSRWDSGHHFSSHQLYAPTLRTPDIRIRHFRSSARYSANWEACRQRGRITMQAPLLLAGDIELNPGPSFPGQDRLLGDTRHRQRGGVKIMLQNVRSLRNKLGTMRTNSVELGQNDVIAITESWLSQDVTDSELQAGLSDRTWFRRDRPTHGGGVACAVRSSMSPARRCDLEPADA